MRRMILRKKKNWKKSKKKKNKLKLEIASICVLYKFTYYFKIFWMRQTTKSILQWKQEQVQFHVYNLYDVQFSI